MARKLCKYCGCCSANDDDSPGCIGTIPAGAHDGWEHLGVSGYMKMQRRLAQRMAERPEHWWNRWLHG